MTTRKEEYLKLKKEGLSLREIGEKCGVSHQAVSQALKYAPREGKRGRKPGSLRGADGKARCYKCKQTLPVSEFHKGANGKPTWLCKRCTSIKMAEYGSRKILAASGVPGLIASINSLKTTLAVREQVLLNNSTKRGKK